MHQKNIELGKELLSVNEKLQNQIVTDECEDDKEIVTKNSTFSKYKRKLTSFMNAFIKKWGLLLLFILIFEIVMFTIKKNLTGVRHAQFNRIQEVSSALIAMSLGSMLIWYRLTGLTIKWANLYKEIFKILLAIFLISSFSIWLFYYIYVPDGSIIVEICFLCFAIFMHLAIFLVLTTIVEKIIDFLLPNVDIYLLKSKKLHTIFCILAAFLFTTVGFVAVASPPTVKSIDLKIKNLPPSFEKFSISLITDIHIGPSVGQKRVKQIVDISNSLQPDVVTVVGDTVDGFLPYLSERALPLANLKSKYGTFAVTGNHEYYHSDIDKWIEFFQNQLNLTVLLNDHKIISKYQKSNETICIAGVDDYFTKRLFIDGHKMDPEKALSACPQNGTTILLVHQPHAAAKILDETNQKVDLVLSGHHHGGGLYISYPFAYFFVSYLHGLHKHLLTGTQIYISAGINYWGPAVKMIDFCEITLIRLIAEQ